MISGAVTQCHALPRAPQHLKGLGLLTIKQPAGHVTAQVAARLDCVLLPNSTVTRRVSGAAGGPANSCQEEVGRPAQSSQTYSPSSTFNKQNIPSVNFYSFSQLCSSRFVSKPFDIFICLFLLKVHKARFLNRNIVILSS